MSFTGDRKNNQDILDYLYQKFCVEKVPMCVDVEGECVYAPQTPEQIGCAVGCLLTPEEQKKADKVTDTAVVRVMQKFPKWFDGSQLRFLTDCQRQHDSDNLCLPETYTYFASKHNLTNPAAAQQEVVK